MNGELWYELQKILSCILLETKPKMEAKVVPQNVKIGSPISMILLNHRTEFTTVPLNFDCLDNDTNYVKIYNLYN